MRIIGANFFFLGLRVTHVTTEWSNADYEVENDVDDVNADDDTEGDTDNDDDDNDDDDDVEHDDEDQKSHNSDNFQARKSRFCMV